MLRVSRSLAVVAVLVTALVAAVPVQAATPELTRSTWTSVLSWWNALAASFAGAGGEQESGLSVVAGNAGPDVSPDGFAPTESVEGLGDEPAQQNTLNPDEPPTEAGPRISPDG